MKHIHLVCCWPIHKLLLFLWLGVRTSIATGQVTVTMPVSRIVFQRNNNNAAAVPIQASCADNITSVQVRMVPRQGGTTTNWYPFTPQNGIISGELPNVQGGWYDLELNAFNQGNSLGITRIERVGVGEVFIAAGQSNAQGFPYPVGASDDRVSCVNYYDGAVTEWRFPFAFSQLTGDSRVGPLNTSYFYGLLGDKLVQRLGVPVLILGSAIAATSSSQWAQSAQVRTDIPDNLLWDGADDGRPYRAIGATLNHYVKRTGVRAILWHQGESDKGKSPVDYRSNLETLINKTRNDIGFPSLSWVIARTSWIDGGGDNTIIAAQNQLISAIPACFTGPNTDAFGNEFRKDGTHFAESFYPTLAELWNQSLTASFFQNAQPFIHPSAIATITTGHPQPIRQYAGGHLTVPFMVSGPVQSNTVFTAQLVDDSGNLRANLGSGTTSPLTVFLPDNVDGTFRVKVVASTPGHIANASERITVFQQSIGKGSGMGLMGNYINSPNADAQPAFSRLEGPIDFVWFETSPAPGLGGRDFSIRWKGQLEVPVSGLYRFKTNNDDGTRLLINNQVIIDDWNARPWAVIQYGQIYLEANHKYSIQLDLLQGWFTAQAKLLWILPGQNQAVYVPKDRLYNDSSTPLQLINPQYNCQTGAFEFQHIGGDSSPISYMAIGITGWTTSAGSFVFTPAPDAQALTLYARQSSNPMAVVQYVWDWRNACANTPLTQPRNPEVHLPAGAISGVVGQPFSYGIPVNLFHDPAGLPLSYAITGLPAGLAATGLQLVGTPSMAGTYLVTITATNSAGLSVTTQLTVTINPAGSAPGQPLQLKQPLYECTTGQFTFQSSGGEGNAVEYMAIGITGWTTTPGIYIVKPAQDAQPFTLLARPVNNPYAVVRFIWDWKAACAN